MFHKGVFLIKNKILIPVGSRLFKIIILTAFKKKGTFKGRKVL